MMMHRAAQGEGTDAWSLMLLVRSMARCLLTSDDYGAAMLCRRRGGSTAAARGAASRPR